jgi:CheY-like chemotaxis protein
MREMFLEEGFNDYLSKPISRSKLDEILLKWMPQEKQQTE